MKVKLIISLLALASFSSVLISNYVVEKSAQGLIFSDPTKVPEHNVGLILGCSKSLKDGRQNRFFRYRIDAAVELFNAGKIKNIIVSGDNSVSHYDEPNDMKLALIRKGVPEKSIFCDYAGFRTLDSVVRAKEIFNMSKLIVISQNFHVKRAICIGKARGVSLVGFNAKEVNALNAFKTKAREFLARTKMILDLYVLNTQPKFLGPKISIPENA